MASSSAALLSAYSCSKIASTSINIPLFFNNNSSNKQQKPLRNPFRIRASSDEQDDCNVDECAPEKEVGKVSMEWLAGEKTKVVGTSPPRKRDWSGYVEKDTAGQTNIYSVEPAVYVAESAISSGSSGTSADGSENTAAIIGGLALLAIATASSILINIGKNPPQIQTFDYSGPSLTYYINKFKSTEIVQDSPPIEAEVSSISPEPETSTPEVPQIQVESDPGTSTPEVPQIQVESG